MPPKNKRKKKSNSNVIHINNDALTVQADTEYYSIDYYKKLFVDEAYYKRFIKSVEKIVRTSDEYSIFLAHIANEYGLNHCAIHPNIENVDNETIVEMHHGPLFTLYDICSIITQFMLQTGRNVSSFTVADRVIKEHGNNNIQVVMLCENCHQLQHAGKLFVDLRQCYGNLPEFVSRYGEYMDINYRILYNKYLEQQSKFSTTDNGLMKMNMPESWNIQKKKDASWRTHRLLEKYKDMD